MTALRERMIEDLQLHGLSEITQKAYVRAVRQLAEHYHKPPDQKKSASIFCISRRSGGLHPAP
jgi:hypothetical protein